MIYIFLADGFEEIEALAVVDILRRAEVPVKTVSISKSFNISLTSSNLYLSYNILSITPAK